MTHSDKIEDDDRSTVELEEMIEMSSSSSEERVSRSNLDRRFVVSCLLTPIDWNTSSYLNVGSIARTRSSILRRRRFRRIGCGVRIRKEEWGRECISHNLFGFDIVRDEAL